MKKDKKRRRLKDHYKKPEYAKVKFKWKPALIMIGSGIAAYFVMKLLLTLGFYIVWIIYELAAAIPAIAYVIAVRGRLGKIPEKEEIVTPMTDEEKTAFIEGEKERRKKAKIWLYIALPFIIAVMLGFIGEYYLPLIIPDL